MMALYKVLDSGMIVLQRKPVENCVSKCCFNNPVQNKQEKAGPCETEG